MNYKQLQLFYLFFFHIQKHLDSNEHVGLRSVYENKYQRYSEGIANKMWDVMILMNLSSESVVSTLWLEYEGMYIISNTINIRDNSINITNFLYNANTKRQLVTNSIYEKTNQSNTDV